jgi:serine phosphatase RsbU (regulator of sigma subunit)
MFRLILIFLLCTFSVSNLSSQRSSDTVAVNSNIRLSDRLLERNTDSAIYVIRPTLSDAVRIKYAYGSARASMQLGRYYMFKGQYDSAIVAASGAVKYARICKDTNLIISSYLMSSRAYSSASRYNNAIEHCIVAQQYAEHKKDIKFQIKINHDLGFIYSHMRLNEKAILYYRKGLKLSLQASDTFNYANISARLGGEFDIINQYDSALKYNKQALQYFSFIKHKRGIGVSLVNLAANYKGLKKYDKAIETYLEAIKIRTELGDEYALTILNNGLAACYSRKKDYKNALKAAKEAELLSKKQNDLPLLMETYNQLYVIYYAIDDYQHGLLYANKYIHLKDSMYDVSNIKSLTELQTKYESEKKEKEIELLQLEKKNAEEITAAENTRRNIVLSSVSVIAILIAGFSIMLFRRFKESNKQKNIIGQQKQIVDSKNKEIIDSINYAQTIQEALIPSEKEIAAGFRDGFVIFKPKDIVSGDFYWQASTGDYHFIVAADCTGHGVPGAFMSMMGISFLNEIINEKRIYDTNIILDLLREKVIGSLNKTGGKDKRDGMDMIILRIDLKGKKVMFSGANNSVYHLSAGTLNEIKGDKAPVGLYHNELSPYTSLTFAIDKGHRIFATTDGFPDQFGGPKGKKFMYKAFESLLTSNSENSLAVQKQNMLNAFENWKGNNEQVDDITVIGIEI